MLRIWAWSPCSTVAIGVVLCAHLARGGGKGGHRARSTPTARRCTPTADTDGSSRPCPPPRRAASVRPPGWERRRLHCAPTLLSCAASSLPLFYGGAR